jgi:NAD(P)-dependent dehydrogenase (short-subunit alcohol dehydrogenase family)
MAAMEEKHTASQLAEKYSARIKGKIILVTGVSPNSLGSHFVRTLAAHSPRLLILAGRSTNKTQAAAASIKSSYPDVPTRVLELDLSSLDAVRKAAEQVMDWDDVPHVDVLVANAGIMATEYGLTKDGFETQLATNHLGHFLFVNLLLGKVLKAEKPRVVVVSSDGHRLSGFRFADYNFDVRLLDIPSKGMTLTLL